MTTTDIYECYEAFQTAVLYTQTKHSGNFSMMDSI